MMTTIQINSFQYKIDLERLIDISIPLNFDGPQPNAYGVEMASSKPVEAGGLVGDTRLGGSCNFERYTFISHCNGTHTECVGHITNDRISVRDCLRDVFIPALLVSVSPEWIDTSDDLVITRESIEGAAKLSAGSSDKALIVRTLPNDDSKLSREYGDAIPPYFSAEAMRYIVECGFKHLLVDLPSIDRIYDNGTLANHRTFWNVEAGSFETNMNTHVNSTITEMIYAANEVEDGEYLLNLQIAPFDTDASPSRPILFKLSIPNISA